MKKILLIISLCLCLFSSKAQDIIGLDEVALLGDWSTWAYAENTDNVWPAMEGRRLVSINFSDEGKTTILVQRANFTTFATIAFYGYIIGGTSTGHYTLHFIQQAESETWKSS